MNFDLQSARHSNVNCKYVIVLTHRIIQRYFIQYEFSLQEANVLLYYIFNLHFAQSLYTRIYESSKENNLKDCWLRNAVNKIPDGGL